MEQIFKSSQRSTIYSWTESLFGVLPTLIFGLAVTFYEAGIPFLMRGFISNYILYGFLLLMAGIAWYKGSPRWSYSYTGFLLLFTWYREDFEMPNSGELWGWRAWIPLLSVVLVVFLFARSVKPAVAFFKNIRQDWTLFSFGIYGMAPLLSWWLFDEIRAPGLIVSSLSVIYLLLLVGALFYLRSTSTKWRVAALLIALLPTFVILILVPTFYWHGRSVPYLTEPINGYSQILPGIIFFSTITLGMFFPGVYQFISSKFKPRLLRGV